MKIVTTSFLFWIWHAEVSGHELPSSNRGHEGGGNHPEHKRASICPSFRAPQRTEKAQSARWLLHSLDWAVVSTMSERMASFPFGNIVSIVDGPCDNSTGTLYLFGSPMDQTFIDTDANPRVSVTVSQAMLDPNDRNCGPGGDGDAENPLCARLVLTGHLEQLPDGEKYQTVKKWFNERHPAIQHWPEDHGWMIVQLVMHDAWFINFFGGATVLDNDTFAKVELSLQPMSHHQSFNGDATVMESSATMIAAVLLLVAGIVMGWFGSHWCGERVEYAKIVEQRMALQDTELS